MKSGGLEGSQMRRLGMGRIQKSCVPPIASSGGTASGEANFSAIGPSVDPGGVRVGTRVAVGERGGGTGSVIGSDARVRTRRGAGEAMGMVRSRVYGGRVEGSGGGGGRER